MIESYNDLSKSAQIAYSAFKRGSYTAEQINTLVPNKITSDEAAFILG